MRIFFISAITSLLCYAAIAESAEVKQEVAEVENK